MPKLDIPITKGKLYSFHVFCHESGPEIHATLHLYAGETRVSEFYLRPPESANAIPETLRDALEVIAGQIEHLTAEHCQIKLGLLPAPKEVRNES